VLSVIALSVITAAVFYGGPRFRMVGEVALIISAGVALDALWTWLRAAPAREPVVARSTA
jgi:hypothetical protein